MRSGVTIALWMHLLEVRRQYIISIREDLEVRNWGFAADEDRLPYEDDGDGSIKGLEKSEMDDETILVEVEEGVEFCVEE